MPTDPKDDAEEAAAKTWEACMGTSRWSSPAGLLNSFAQAFRAYREAGVEAARREEMAAFLIRRHIETPCSKCGGAGVRAYGDSATWRGGIGGQRVTADVCDHCWGSGDEHRRWLNLRTIPDKREAEVAALKEAARRVCQWCREEPLDNAMVAQATCIQIPTQGRNVWQHAVRWKPSGETEIGCAAGPIWDLIAEKEKHG